MAVRRAQLGGQFGGGVQNTPARQVDFAGIIDAVTNGTANLLQQAALRKIAKDRIGQQQQQYNDEQAFKNKTFQADQDFKQRQLERQVAVDQQTHDRNWNQDAVTAQRNQADAEYRTGELAVRNREADIKDAEARARANIPKAPVLGTPEYLQAQDALARVKAKYNPKNPPAPHLLKGDDGFYQLNKAGHVERVPMEGDASPAPVVPSAPSPAPTGRGVVPGLPTAPPTLGGVRGAADNTSFGPASARAWDNAMFVPAQQSQITPVQPQPPLGGPKSPPPHNPFAKAGAAGADIKRADSYADKYDKEVAPLRDQYVHLHESADLLPDALKGNAAAQTDILNNFIRAMHPKGTPRESERKLIAAAAPLQDRVQGELNALANRRGYVVAPVLLNQMTAIMRQIADENGGRAEEARSRWQKRANLRGVSAEDMDVLFPTVVTRGKQLTAPHPFDQFWQRQ